MEKSSKRPTPAARTRRPARKPRKDSALRSIARACASELRGIVAGALVTSLLFVAVSYATSGHIPNEKLDAELFDRIRREIGHDVIVEFKKVENLHGFDNNTIVYFYYSAKPGTDGRPEFVGRHVTFFDKARENVLDRLLKREAGYRKTATFSFEVHDGPDPDNTLIPIDARVGDLDNDGLPELLVRYATEWGDGVGYSCLIFRWDGKTYQVSQLPNLLDWLPKDGSIDWTEALWQPQVRVTGLPFDHIVAYFNGGDFMFQDFEGRGAVRLMAVVPYGGSVLGPHDALIGVFEPVDGAFRPDKNWNDGNFKVLAAVPEKLRKRLNRTPTEPLPEQHNLVALVQRGFATHVVEGTAFYPEYRYGKLKERRREEEIEAAVASVAPAAEAAPQPQ